MGSKVAFLTRNAFFAIALLFCANHALAIDVKLAWDANTETNLSGYKVYYGTSSRTYGTPINAGNVTTYTVTNLSNGTYYFAVTAYNTTGQESGYSNEVVATLSCTYSISPLSQSFSLQAATGTIAVSAEAGCGWTASSGASWITITSGSTGSGSGSISYAVDANTSMAPRTATITAAGQIFTIIQSGISCSFAIAPASQAVGSGAQTGTVSVTASSGCTWTAASNVSWITVTSGSSGNGNGTVGYSVLANTASASRTGTLTIGGQTFTLTQAGVACTTTLSPASQSVSEAASTGSVAVTSAAGCSWSASSNDNWITITSGSSGNGNGSVGYSVAANTTANSRSGTVTIGGQIFTLNQAPLNCQYSLSPPSVALSEAGGSGTVAVSAAGGCAWSYTTNATWLTITTVVYPSGGGNGVVNYSAAPNTGASPRTGTMTIAGQTFTATEASASCAYTISSSGQSFADVGGSGTVTVSTAAGCAWTVTSTASWLVPTSAGSGTGNATIGYSVQANTATSSRSASLTIGGQSFSVTQSALACSYTITPASQSFLSSAGSYSVAVTAASGCPWTAASSVDWMTIVSGSGGNGPGTVSYAVASNTSPNSRSASMTIAGQTFTAAQAGSQCSYSITPGSQSFSDSAGSGTVTVTAPSGCSWSATSSVDWVSVSSGASGAGNGIVGYALKANTTTAARTGSLSVAGQTFIVTQAALACSYSLSSTSQSFDSNGAAGSVVVSTQNGCAWTATSNSSWLHITSGAGGNASGILDFSLAPNSDPAARTGTLTVAGQTYTVTQAAFSCSYSISPQNQTVGSDATSGTVAVTSAGGCNWTATSNAAWLSITSGNGGSGNGAVGYAVQGNTGTSVRTGTLTIAGQSFAVTQAGIGCSYSITPMSQAASEAAGTGAVAVIAPAGCSWTAASANGWLSITSSGTGVGNGAVSYLFSENTSSSYRTGTIAIGGRTFTLTQSGISCTYSISPAARSFSDPAGTGSVSVTAPAGCSWTAASNNSWLTILSGSIASGAGTVTFAVSPNDIAASRTGTLTVAGQTFTVSQSGIGCTYSISPTAHSVSSTATAGAVSVTAQSACAWTAVSNVDWLTVSSGSGTSGNGVVNYLVAANSSTSNRTGVISIAGQTFTLTQVGTTCSYSISPTAQSLSQAASSGSVSVTATGGCNWTAASNADWITIDSGSSGTGNGTVNFSAAPNTSASPRAGTLTVAGQSFSVAQAGTTCSYSISPPDRTVGDVASTGVVVVTAAPSCAWSAVSNTGWITISAGASGSGNGSVTYLVASNTSTSARTGTITIAGQTFTLSQSAVSCIYSLSSPTQAFTNAAANGSVDVSTSSSCNWTATSNAGWLTITSGAAGAGNGTVRFAITANAGTSSRDGTITIGNQAFTVSQSPLACTSNVTPASQSFGGAAGSGSVAVSAPSGCTWTAASSASWITLSSGSSGTGNGTVNYLVSANTGPASRSGTLTVAGQTITISQSLTSCAFTLTPTSQSFNDAATTGSVEVAYSPGCTWTATSNAGWLSVSYINLQGGSSSGKGTVNYSVAANASGGPRTGTLTIAGQAFAVTQNAVVCKFTLSPASAFFSETASAGTVAISGSSGCSWSASSDSSWVKITSMILGSGSGNGIVNYTVAANTSPNSRAGRIVVGEQYFEITQAGICTFQVSSVNQTFDARGGSGRVPVLATAQCPWTASTADAWISLPAGAGGTGNGTADFMVAPNTSTSTRHGSIVVADTIVYVTQDGIACTYSLAPASQAFADAGATASIGVTASSACAWTATSDSPWLTITSGSSGKGIGTIGFSITDNTSADPRTGTISVGDQTFLVTQAGFACKYAISPGSQSFSESAGTGSILVSTTSACAWSATSSTGWITITSQGGSSGSGPVVYSVAANTSAAARTATITINNKSFTVNQAGVLCIYSISPGSQSFSANSGTGSIQVATTSACAWTATSIVPWITLTSDPSGTGNGSISYSVAANTEAEARSGNVTIGGQIFTVTQATAACTYSISPVSDSFELRGGEGTVSVVAPAGCAWTASSNVPWLSINSGASGIANVTVSYSVAANDPQSAFRVGTMTIAGQTFTVAQTNASCAISISPANQHFSISGGSGSVTIAAGSGCAWNAQSNADWITLTSAASGTGGGTLSFVVGASAAAAREGTITIAGQTFTAAQVTQFTSSFPQFSRGDDWVTTLVVTNPSPTDTAHGAISFFDNDGLPQALPINGELPAGRIEFSMPPLASAFFAAAAGGSSRGSARVVTDIPIGGVVQYAHPTLGRTGVPESPALSGAILFVVRNGAQNKNTEITLQNPDNAQLNLLLSLRGLDGVQVTGGSAFVTLPPYGSSTRTLDTLFPDASTGNFQGTVVLAPDLAGNRVSVSSLFVGAEAGQFASLPVVPIAASSAPTQLYFAQFVNGLEWTSAIYLANPLQTVGSGTVTYLDDFGNRISNSTGNRLSSVDVFTGIQPFGAAIIPAEGQGRIVSGSTKAAMTSGLGGVLAFASPSLGTAAVPASTPMPGFIVPASRSVDGNLRTGVAIASVGSPVSVVLTLRDQQGQIVAGGEEVKISLPPNGHLARFVEELFPNADTLGFQGTITVGATGGNVVGTALLLGVNRGDLISLPVTAIR